MQYIIKIICNKRIHVPLALRGSGLCKEPPCFITWLQMSGTRKERDFGERDREKGKPSSMSIWKRNCSKMQQTSDWDLCLLPSRAQEWPILKAQRAFLKWLFPCSWTIHPKPDSAASSKSLRLAYFSDFFFLPKTSLQSHCVKQAENLAGRTELIRVAENLSFKFKKKTSAWIKAPIPSEISTGASFLGISRPLILALEFLASRAKIYHKPLEVKNNKNNPQLWTDTARKKNIWKSFNKGEKNTQTLSKSAHPCEIPTGICMVQ